MTTPTPIRTTPAEMGRRIRRRRRELDLSQTDVGEALGVDHSVISKIEHGKRGMSVVFLGRLCEVLDVLEEQLTRESSDLSNPGYPDAAEWGISPRTSDFLLKSLRTAAAS